MERYDPEKDFGFMSIKEMNQDIYFRLITLKTNEMENIYDSDIVYCSLEQGNKGVVISSIYGFVEGKNEFQLERCIVKNFNSKRGFGFVQVGSSSNEVFFHRTAFPANFYEHLKEGLEFLAEIRLREDGKYQVRRCIELL